MSCSIGNSRDEFTGKALGKVMSLTVGWKDSSVLAHQLSGLYYNNTDYGFSGWEGVFKLVHPEYIR